ncbi:Alpha/Beta hydrolase protein [Aspergillus keveii]|uniref:Alpha/Beta hydrolase protein n=1 Tax=Aspergillus keveii TaxID=714993 RepID=A0ABR4FGM8_9EURO
MTTTGLSREAILESSDPHPAFQEIAAAQGGKPSLPSDVDILTLRNVTNTAKAKARESNGPPPSGLTERDIEIPMRDGTKILAHVYSPSEGADDNELPLFVFFHGGGFCIGNRHDDWKSNRAIALRNRVVVISPEYRLAPEYPFPYAVHDGLDAVQWVAANARVVHPLASPSAGLIVGGTSSGGNVANAVVYLNRDQEYPVKVTGQFLSVPPLLPPPVVPEKYRPDYISFGSNKQYSIPSGDIVSLFMGAYRPDITSPLMVPINHPSGHSGVPPTYFQVCGLDGLRDENLIYERILREENSVPTLLHFYPGLPHHFWEFYPQLTEEAEKRTEDTIRGLQWLLEIGLR